MRSLAVIGAGIAGLTAARELARGGLEVVVFEKARGVGGRTSTRRREDHAFDHGAQYFTCRESETFARQVKQWCRDGVAAQWHVPIRTLPHGDLPPVAEASTRYVGVPGMSALARDLARNLRVECGTRVERVEPIEGSAAPWRLISEAGQALGVFDAVVVATPAPQAVPLLAAAPRLSGLAARVEMRPCHALMVTFRESLGLDFGAAFVTESPLGWVARNSSKPERPGGECWVLHSSPEWSARHLEDPPEAVSRLLLRAFEDSLGRELPVVLSDAVHLWRLARTAEPLGPPFLWDPEAGLGICGDWTHGARVEDAFTSGALLARAMSGEMATTSRG